MMLYFARCRRAGFTLIEIMIVIAIIAILAGIVVPNIVMARFEAGITACCENCKVGMSAVQAFLVRHSLRELGPVLHKEYKEYSNGDASLSGLLFPSDGTYGLDGLVEAGYLGKPLRCPWTGGGYHYVWEHRNGAGYGYYYNWTCEAADKFMIWDEYSKVECSGNRDSNPLPTRTHCLKGPFANPYATPCYEERVGVCFR